jgi:hypothetical protein
MSLTVVFRETALRGLARIRSKDTDLDLYEVDEDAGPFTSSTSQLSPEPAGAWQDA